VDLCHAQVFEDLGDFVVDGVNQVSPGSEGRQPFPGQGQGFLVTVDADQMQIREALQHGFGVAAHAERRINGDRGFAPEACGFKTGGQQINAPVLQDRHVAFGRWLRVITHAFVLSCRGCWFVAS